MVTYKWDFDGGVVYINGVTAATENSSDIELAQKYAATLVNDEVGFMKAFNANVKPKLNTTKQYSDYYSADDSCAYGICSVCTSIHETEDGVTRVTSNIVGESSRVLYIDFYNIAGKDGVNGASPVAQYTHVAHAVIEDGAFKIVDNNGSHIGFCYNSYQEGSAEWSSISGNTSLYTWSKVAYTSDEINNVTTVAWDDLSPDEKAALKEELRGYDGTDGVDGTASNNAFKSIVFRKSNIELPRPVGGSYFRPIPDGGMWSDGVPESDESGNKSAQLWMSSRTFSSDGEYPQDAEWSKPMPASDSDTIDFEFASTITMPANTPGKTKPSDEADAPWSNVANEYTVWMASRHVKNGEYTDDWSITRIKGEDGEDGRSINVKGVYDNIESFLIDWAEEGAGFNDITGKIINGDWLVPTDVDPEFNETWCYKVDGNLWSWDGSDEWINLGPYNGGTFMHVKYANEITAQEYVLINDEDVASYVESLDKYLKFTVSERIIDGETYTIYGEDAGKYIGICTDNNENDRAIISIYSWQKWAGKDGFGREYIFKATSTEEERPDVPNSENDTVSDWTKVQDSDFVPSGWSDNAMSLSETNAFIWVCSRNFTDGVWGDFRGSQEDTTKPSLWARYAKDGISPKTSYTSIIFKRGDSLDADEEFRKLNDSTQKANLGSYDCPLTTYMQETLNWSDGIPSGSTESIWMSSRVFWSEEAETDKMSWSKPIRATDTASIDYEWTDIPIELANMIDGGLTCEKSNPNYTGSTEINGATGYFWYDEPISNATYMAVRQVSEDVYKDGSTWQISQIKGESGVSGLSVTIGSGLTGQELSSTNGANEGEMHMCTEDYTNGDISFVKGHMYTWDGDSWEDAGQFKGENGDPGDNAYIHIKYATDSIYDTLVEDEVVGSKTYSNFYCESLGTYIVWSESAGENPGTYVGIGSDNNPDDELDYSKYKWSRSKGEDGWGYEYIYALTETEIAPLVPLYADNDTWNSLSDQNKTGRYNTGTVNGVSKTGEEAKKTTDFIPDTPEIIWYDNAQSPTASKPYCWVCYRVREDGIWSDFKGSQSNDKFEAALWAKYAFDGIAPKTCYTSFIFKRSNSFNVETEYANLTETSKKSSLGTYENPISEYMKSTLGWSDDIPNTSQENVWMSSRVFWSVETDNDATSWSKPVMATDTSSIDYEWTSIPVEEASKITGGIKCDKATPSYTGTTEITGVTGGYVWSDTPISEATYMAMREVVGDSYKNGSEWKITQIKGENGVNGLSVTIGSDMTGGQLSVATGGSVGEMHMCSESFSSGDVSFVKGHMYTWDGDSWEDAGEFQGREGTSAYVHIKYADDSKYTSKVEDEEVGGARYSNFYSDGLGKWIIWSESAGENPGKYIGVGSDANQEDPLDYTKYKWTLSKGEDGWGYEYIYALTSTENAPLVPTRVTQAQWDSMTDEQRKGKYKSGKDSNGNTIDASLAGKTTDFVPVTTDVTWTDNMQSPTSGNPYCWVCHREKIDGTWTEFKGVESDETSVAALWTRYAKDGARGPKGENGQDGQDANSGKNMIGQFCLEELKEFEYDLSNSRLLVDCDNSNISVKQVIVILFDTQNGSETKIIECPIGAYSDIVVKSEKTIKEPAIIFLLYANDEKNGREINAQAVFKLKSKIEENVSYSLQFKFDFDAVNNDIIVNNIKLERGASSTDWSIADNDVIIHVNTVSQYVDTVKSDLQDQIDGMLDSYFLLGRPSLLPACKPISDWFDEDGLSESEIGYNIGEYKGEKTIIYKSESATTVLERHVGDTYTSVSDYDVDLCDEDVWNFPYKNDCDGIYSRNSTSDTKANDYISTDLLIVSSGLTAEKIPSAASLGIDVMYSYYSLENSKYMLKKQDNKGADMTDSTDEADKINAVVITVKKAQLSDYINRIGGEFRYAFKNTSSGKSWRFCNFEDSDSSTFHWHEISDSDSIRALQIASKAVDTADGKRTVFTSTPTPPYSVGDLWANATANSGNGKENNYKDEMLVCKKAKSANQTFDISDWSPSSRAVATAEAAATSAATSMANLSYMADDNKITAQELPALKDEWQSIVKQHEATLEAANTLSLNGSAECSELVDAYNKLDGILNGTNGVFVKVTTETPYSFSDGGRAEFVAAFADWYTANTAMLSKIASVNEVGNLSVGGDNILHTETFTIETRNDTGYNWKSVYGTLKGAKAINFDEDAYLENGADYIFSVEGISAATTTTTATKVSVLLYDATNGNRYASASTMNVQNSRQTFKFKVPSTNNYTLICYAGSAGSTEGQSITYISPMLIKGTVEVSYQYPSYLAKKANNILSDMASDGKLTPQEKLNILKEWNQIQSKYALLRQQAELNGVSHVSLDNAKTSLNTILNGDNGVLTNMSTTSAIDSTFDNAFKTWYDEEIKITNAVENKISSQIGGENLIGESGITFSVPTASSSLNCIPVVGPASGYTNSGNSRPKAINYKVISPGTYSFSCDSIALKKQESSAVLTNDAVIKFAVTTAESLTSITALSQLSFISGAVICNSATTTSFNIASTVTGRTLVMVLSATTSLTVSGTVTKPMLIASGGETYKAYTQHIKDALAGNTDVNGGLVLTNVIMLKNNAGSVTAGISGVGDANASTNGVTLWGGGTYAQAVADATTGSTTNNLPVLLTKTGIGSKIGPFKVINKNAIQISGSGYITLSASTYPNITISGSTNLIKIGGESSPLIQTSGSTGVIRLGGSSSMLMIATNSGQTSGDANVIFTPNILNSVVSGFTSTASSIVKRFTITPTANITLGWSGTSAATIPDNSSPSSIFSIAKEWSGAGTFNLSVDSAIKIEWPYASSRGSALTNFVDWTHNINGSEGYGGARYIALFLVDSKNNYVEIFQDQGTTSGQAGAAASGYLSYTGDAKLCAGTVKVYVAGWASNGKSYSGNITASASTRISILAYPYNKPKTVIARDGFGTYYSPNQYFDVRVGTYRQDITIKGLPTSSAQATTNGLYIKTVDGVKYIAINN